MQNNNISLLNYNGLRDYSTSIIMKDKSTLLNKDDDEIGFKEK